MITVLIGKSAAGKSTIANRLIQSENKKLIVPYTTRPMRPGEKEGEDYYFLSRKEFEKMEEDGWFAESRHYNVLVEGVPDVWYYGTGIVDPKEDHLVILDIDALLSYINKYGPSALEVIEVYIPDEIRQKRAQDRPGFDESEWTRRFKDDEVKFSKERIDLVKKTGVRYTRYDNS